MLLQKIIRDNQQEFPKVSVVSLLTDRFLAAIKNVALSF